jgi:hypothetical protein
MLYSNRVDIRMCIRIRDIRFVFVFENIRICIRIACKCGKKCYPDPIPNVSDLFPSLATANIGPSAQIVWPIVG